MSINVETFALAKAYVEKALESIGANVGIQSIKQTTTSTADGGSNVFTVTLTDGTTATFTVKNGSKGSAGVAGTTGTAGTAGKDGSNGTDGKSAYQYAQDGGYTGTEEEFAVKLAELMAMTVTNVEE